MYPVSVRVRPVRRVVPVVDLFSGPGGLAEGFAALRSPKGRRRFQVALSIEKDRDAHRTLRLRAFLRHFVAGPPSEYYDFLNGIIAEEPSWARLYPKQWAAACDEAKCLELGTPEATAFMAQRVKEISQRHRGRTVLLGGPPCQSYSVIGRSRNVGNGGYDPDEDHRQLLYEEYIQVLDRLCPAVAVMENVRGILSARRRGQPIFEEVMRRLGNAGNCGGYRLFALTPRSEARSWDEGLVPEDFLVRAENHGVPQSRHRVIVICVRRDLADTLPRIRLPQLEEQKDTVSVTNVIGAMPMLRSRLSRGDTPDAWQNALQKASDLVASNRPAMSRSQEVRFRRAVADVRRLIDGSALPFHATSGNVELPAQCPPELRSWMFDDRVTRLANNETKSHMPADLERYLFASIFAHTFGRSPSSSAFPMSLAPNHANWHTGKFADRYRVQVAERPCTTVTSHIAKDGHYYIHPDPRQCRSLTVREAARLQTFPDNYFFHGTRTQQYTQVGNAVPPFLAYQIARTLWSVVEHFDQVALRSSRRTSMPSTQKRVCARQLSLPRLVTGDAA